MAPSLTEWRPCRPRPALAPGRAESAVRHRLPGAMAPRRRWGGDPSRPWCRWPHAGEKPGATQSIDAKVSGRINAGPPFPCREGRGEVARVLRKQRLLSRPPRQPSHREEVANVAFGRHQRPWWKSALPHTSSRPPAVVQSRFGRSLNGYGGGSAIAPPGGGARAASP